MDVRLQAKLLRAIQERVIDRVGGTRPVPVDIRIIATSNRNLGRGRARGHVPRGPAVPPQRREPENPAAARAAGRRARTGAAFRQEICRRQRRAAAAAVGGSAARAGANRWPGNVRELENTIHRAVLLAQRRRDRRRRHPDARRRAARSRQDARRRWRMPRSPPSR